MPTREQLHKRATKALIEAGKPAGRKLTDSEKVTPSQRRSDLMRKKFAKKSNTGTIIKPEQDCRGCPEKPTCEKTLETCGKDWNMLTCPSCGRRTRFRHIATESWKKCTECKERYG
jgi:hypothetical protein